MRRPAGRGAAKVRRETGKRGRTVTQCYISLNRRSVGVTDVVTVYCAMCTCLAARQFGRAPIPKGMRCSCRLS